MKISESFRGCGGSLLGRLLFQSIETVNLLHFPGKCNKKDLNFVPGAVKNVRFLSYIYPCFLTKYVEISLATGYSLPTKKITYIKKGLIFIYLKKTMNTVHLRPVSVSRFHTTICKPVQYRYTGAGII